MRLGLLRGNHRVTFESDARTLAAIALPLGVGLLYGAVVAIEAAIE